jgi:hypothetical protein
MDEIKKNRKRRRYEAKLQRSRKVTNRKGLTHWVKRFINEMKENPGVMEKVTSGVLDKYLK